MEAARPVRRTGRGNGPAERPAPRLGPIQPTRCHPAHRRRLRPVHGGRPPRSRSAVDDAQHLRSIEARSWWVHRSGCRRVSRSGCCVLQVHHSCVKSSESSGRYAGGGSRTPAAARRGTAPRIECHRPARSRPSPLQRSLPPSSQRRVSRNAVARERPVPAFGTIRSHLRTIPATGIRAWGR